MIWIFLLLSTAFAQEAPRPEFRDENAYQLLLQLRSGVPVLNSSPTYRGKPTFDSGIIFGDGTEQTTAYTDLTSTQAARITGLSWGSAGIVCRSTLTITASTITIHASIKVVGTGAGNANAGYLIDGACPSGHTCSGTCTSNVNPWETNNDTNHSLTIVARETKASASHDVCIWACSDAGTVASGVLEFWLEGK